MVDSWGTCRRWGKTYISRCTSFELLVHCKSQVIAGTDPQSGLARGNWSRNQTWIWSPTQAPPAAPWKPFISLFYLVTLSSGYTMAILAIPASRLKASTLWTGRRPIWLGSPNGQYVAGIYQKCWPPWILCRFCNLSHGPGRKFAICHMICPFLRIWLTIDSNQHPDPPGTSRVEGSDVGPSSCTRRRPPPASAFAGTRIESTLENANWYHWH